MTDIDDLIARLRSPAWEMSAQENLRMQAIETIQRLREEVSELRALDNEAQHGADALRADRDHLQKGFNAAVATVESLRAELASYKLRIEGLFTAIAHGDDKHRAWLRDAIDRHFDTVSAQGQKPDGPETTEVKAFIDGLEKGA